MMNHGHKGAAVSGAYERYRRAIAGRPLPLAYVDLDALDENCRQISRLADGMPVRIASKSVRSVGVLKYVFSKFSCFRGVMAFSAQEAAYLADHGFHDILIAYPCVDRTILEQALHRTRSGSKITFMLDCIEHGELLNTAAKSIGIVAEGCLDLDMSWRLPGLTFGVHRSPLQNAQDAVKLASAASRWGNVRLSAIMGYEAQLAGVPDHNPYRRLESLAAQFLKRLSTPRVFARRQETVTALRQHGLPITLVNGGGSGSLHLSRADDSLTELTAGSAIFCPTLFDYYEKLGCQPAAGFVLPVTRIPAQHIYTCQSGGFIASGVSGADRLPQPFLPIGAKLLTHEGAGEVQTPVNISGQTLSIGDPIFFRHAKAGELCEHFHELELIKGGAIVDRVKTYRGDGVVFY